MRHVPSLAVLLFGLPFVVSAGEPQAFEWTKEKFDMVATGDAETGKVLAKKYRCKKCHNKDGISDDPEIPSIAGQRSTYMFKQMHDFREGIRDDSDMLKVARKISDDEMIHIGAWYQSLERAPNVGGSAPLRMKVCDSCHDKDIVEEDNQIEVAPILLGQVRQYLEASMQQFREANRNNDLFQRMQSESHKLTDDEVKQIVRYYGAEDIE
ncbi:c-type cytochrome [Thiosocius teredinicola]|uniref:c-type cytochrome n=1 Tax=Thiosocius teredinicola TaxID=1973002 RepID=UPI000F776BAD